MFIPVLSPEQSAEWDRRAEAAGIELATLMETAGRSSAAVLAARFPQAVGQGVLVACGTGNNGGDGWVLARALHRLEVPIWVAALPGPGSALAERMASRARAEGVRCVAHDGPWPGVGLVVDAILGTGARGAPRPPTGALIGRLNDLAVPIIAIDGPTGVDLRTGVVHEVAVRSGLSITFGGLRRGHLLGREEVGDVVVVDIGHPPALPAWPQLVTDDHAAAWLPRLRAEAYKGDRGRVVVLGGDAGMTGALRLAGRSAFGAGAGLVHAVAPAATIAALTAAEPDLQTCAQSFEESPTETLVGLLARADAVVVGPGLGRAPGRREFIAGVLSTARAAVLDADGLIAFQGEMAGLRALAEDRVIVLTPHIGEFRALFPQLASSLELDPWVAAEAAAGESGCTVVLKGVPSVVARSGKGSWTIAAGNPGLATGGSGDLLSGFIGTLLAQGLEPEIAAALGSQVLGRAGDLAARRHTARGMRPMDVISALPDLWRAWAARRQSPPPARPPVLVELDRPLQD